MRKTDKSKIIIRRAKIDDLPQLIVLLKAIAHYHNDLSPIYPKIPKNPSERLVKLIKRRKAILIVAENNKKILGYFAADIRKTRMRVYKSMGYVTDGFVDKRYRRQGIGKSIFSFIKEWFLKHGIRRIELIVDTENEIGIKAWQSYGFKEYQKKMQIEI